MTTAPTAGWLVSHGSHGPLKALPLKLHRPHRLSVSHGACGQVLHVLRAASDADLAAIRRCPRCEKAGQP